MMQNVREVNFAQIHANIIMFFTQLAEKHAGLLAFPQVCARIEMWDQRLFDTLLHILVPEVLRPVGGNAHRTILMVSPRPAARLPTGLLVAVDGLQRLSHGNPCGPHRNTVCRRVARYCRLLALRLASREISQLG